MVIIRWGPGDFYSDFDDYTMLIIIIIINNNIIMYIPVLKETEDVFTASDAMNTGEPTGLTVEEQV